MAVCTECKTELLDGAKYCHECGYPAEDDRVVTGGISDKTAKALRDAEVAHDLWTPSNEEIEALRDVIERAADERPVQEHLAANPHLLIGVLAGGHGRWVRPQVEFGAHYVADFMVAFADSSGIQWWLIELESPTAQVFIQNGELAGKARHGVDQVESWRAWLTENLDAARKPKKQHGLGLSGIDPMSPGVVLIGRRDSLANEERWRRRRLRAERNIHVHTYDWLLENLSIRSGAGAGRPFHALEDPVNRER